MTSYVPQYVILVRVAMTAEKRPMSYDAMFAFVVTLSSVACDLAPLLVVVKIAPVRRLLQILLL